MTFRRFLLIDTLALDVAGVAALATGATTAGVALLVVALLTFAAYVVTGRRDAPAAT